MPHICLDATGAEARHIPLTTPTVLVYVTGSGGVRWSADEIAAFHNSGIVRTNQDNDTNPSVGALFDLERGAGTLAGLLPWARGKQRLGAVPDVYVSESMLPAVEDELVRDGIDVFGIHLANWSLSLRQATERLGGHILAVQFASPSSNPNMIVPGSHLTLAQANVDVSICADDYFPPPHRKQGIHGIASADVSVDLADGHWSARPLPGSIQLGEGGNGAWDAEPLPQEGDYWCAKVRIHRGH